MRTWQIGLVIASIIAPAALCGCQPAYTGEGRPAFKTATIRGTVAYRERIALMVGSTVRVQLLDVTNAGAPVVVCEQTIISDRQPPLDYLLTYDPDSIRPGARYGLSATITTEGVTMWSTPAPMSIVPGAVGGEQALLVVRMRADAQPGQ